MTLKVLNYDNSADRDVLATLINRLRAETASSGHVADTVAAILEDVKTNQDDALVKYMRKWTNPDFTADMIRVNAEELAAAEESLPVDLREAFEHSIANVRAYQKHVMPTDPPTVEIDGAQLGMRFTPMHRAGLHVPGGRAAYPSSVIMLAVPAQVAGVKELPIVSPPPTAMVGQAAGDISPLVLGVCNMLGVSEVYRIGGAQAIAALAYGTESVKAVDFIAGPGNSFTQQAKKQMFGLIGIDGFCGPSEIVVLADESANPAWIASDLIAQAEHDPGCCFLVSTSLEVINKINAELKKQLPERSRIEPIRQSLENWCAAIHVSDEGTALGLVDELAGEHVTLAVEDPYGTLKQLNHGGAWFLGSGTPVASGDYYAGPSHCLPTGTTARYCSGVSVYTFLKRSSVEHYPTRPHDTAIKHITTFANAEGLDAHAASVQARLKND